MSYEEEILNRPNRIEIITAAAKRFAEANFNAFSADDARGRITDRTVSLRFLFAELHEHAKHLRNDEGIIPSDITLFEIGRLHFHDVALGAEYDKKWHLKLYGTQHADSLYRATYVIADEQGIIVDYDEPSPLPALALPVISSRDAQRLAMARAAIPRLSNELARRLKRKKQLGY